MVPFHAEKLLQDDTCPSQVVVSEGNRFIIRPRPVERESSGLIRVYHKLDGDYQSFQSLIVNPDTTGRDVVQVAVTRLSLVESPEAFQLVQKTSRGGKDRRLY